jgi:hypothetical protein
MRKKIKTPTAQETLSMSLGPFPPSFPCCPHCHRRRRPSRSPFYPREQLLTVAVGGVGRGGVLLHRRHPPSWGFPCLPASSHCPIIPVPPRPRCLVVVWFAVVLSLLFVPCWLRRSRPVAPRFHPTSSCSQRWNGVVAVCRRRHPYLPRHRRRLVLVLDLVGGSGVGVVVLWYPSSSSSPSSLSSAVSAVAK